MSAYCDFAPGDPVHGPYHDAEYGFPTADEAVLFERLTLEVFQAGLSWDIILKKRANFRAAFDGFDVDRVAAYGDSESRRLLGDAGIVRNKLKVAATINNAKVIQSFRGSHDGFANWIAANHPLAKEDWVKLFKNTFKFTGGEITGEFLMSIGYLPGVHRDSCPIFAKIAVLNPPWMSSHVE